MITKHQISETSNLHLHWRSWPCVACNYIRVRSRCDNSMPKLIHFSHRKPISCAFHNHLTRIVTIPRHISNRSHVHASGARISTTAAWHSYCTAATLGGRSHHFLPTIGSRTSITLRRTSSADYIRHQQQRCFTHGARAARGLGASKYRDGWDSLQGLWDEGVNDEQNGHEETSNEPQREVIQVNNGEVELE